MARESLKREIDDFFAESGYRRNPASKGMVRVATLPGVALQNFIARKQGRDENLSSRSEEEWRDALADDFGEDEAYMADRLEELAAWGVVDEVEEEG